MIHYTMLIAEPPLLRESCEAEVTPSTRPCSAETLRIRGQARAEVGPGIIAVQEALRQASLHAAHCPVCGLRGRLEIQCQRRSHQTKW